MVFCIVIVLCLLAWNFWLQTRVDVLETKLLSLEKELSRKVDKVVPITTKFKDRP